MSEQVSTRRMNVGVDLSHLQQTSWRDYAIRFFFGGCITALTGVIAHSFGPTVGGLFLAFPAILPASITLVQEHSGKQKAGVNALGAAFGGIGLVVFGLVIWFTGPRAMAWLDLVLATVVWFGVSTAIWFFATRGRPGLPR